MKAVFILITLLLAPLAHADSDKDQFRNEITGNLKKIICNQAYLRCLNIKDEECNNSLNDAVKHCSIDDAYNAVSNTYDNEKEAFKVIKVESVKYGDCVSSYVYKNLNIDEQAAKQCESTISNK